jgi:hypothetical protein
MKLRLIQTCGACPEQYDVYLGDEEIGYMRLRHGHFRAEYKRTIVYSASTVGDGLFEQEERKRHLNLACKAILEAHESAQQGSLDGEQLYSVEYPSEM